MKSITTLVAVTLFGLFLSYGNAQTNIDGNREFEVPEADLVLLTGLLNVRDAFEKLDPKTWNILYLGKSADTKNIRVVFQVCGFTGCDPSQEILIEDDSSAGEADGVPQFPWEIIENPDSLPYDPKHSDFYELGNGIHRYSDCFDRLVPDHNIVLESYITQNEERGRLFHYEIGIYVGFGGIQQIKTLTINQGKGSNQACTLNGAMTGKFDVKKTKKLNLNWSSCTSERISKETEIVKDDALLEARKICQGEAVRISRWKTQFQGCQGDLIVSAEFLCL